MNGDIQLTYEHYDKRYINFRYRRFPLGAISVWIHMIKLIHLMELYILHKNKKVLDIGCGLGFDSYCWYLLGMEVTGIDLSRIAIQKAKSQWSRKRKKQDRLHFVHDDVQAFDYQESYFDFIYCKEFTLTNTDQIYGEKQKRFGETMLRALKPDGIWYWQLRSDGSGTWDKGSETFFPSTSTIYQYFSQFPCFIGEIYFHENSMCTLICHEKEIFQRITANRKTKYELCFSTILKWASMLPTCLFDQLF